jgi:hypothetical protein
LAQAGNKTIAVQGKSISGKRWLAQALWQAITTGQIPMPNGPSLQLAPEDWLALVKWIYTHVDGPATIRAEVTGADGSDLLPVADIIAAMDRVDRARLARPNDDPDRTD